MGTEMNVEAERAAFEAWAKEDRPFDDVRFPGVAAWMAWQKRSEKCEMRVADLLTQLEQKEAARIRLATALEAASAQLADSGEIEVTRRAAQPADVEAGELPELPEPDGSSSVPIDESKFTFTEVDAWSKPLVLQYARDAIAHQSATAQPATDFRALVQSIIEDGYLSETNMHRGRLALDGAAPAQPSPINRVCDILGAFPADLLSRPADQSNDRAMFDSLFDLAEFNNEYAKYWPAEAAFTVWQYARASALAAPAVDQDVLDAKRYRWLRAADWDEIRSLFWAPGVQNAGNPEACMQELDGAIDASILAAIPVTDQAAPKQGKN